MHLVLLALAEDGGLDIFAAKESYIWTILIFALALVPMWKLVFGPIARALDERELRAREAALAAEAARAETEMMKDAIQADLDQARKEAAQQVAEARARAETREKEILATAQSEAEKERARAQAEIARALAAARETLRNDSVELAVQVAQQVLERRFEAADQERLIQEFRKELAAG